MYKFPFYHRYAALLPPLSLPPYNNTIIWWRYTLLWTLVQLKDASTNLHPNILLSTLLSNTPNPSYRARDQVSHPHDTRKITKDSSLLGLHAVSLGKLCSAFQITIHLSSGSSRVKKLCKQHT